MKSSTICVAALMIFASSHATAGKLGSFKGSRFQGARGANNASVTVTKNNDHLYIKWNRPTEKQNTRAYRILRERKLKNGDRLYDLAPPRLESAQRYSTKGMNQFLKSKLSLSLGAGRLKLEENGSIHFATSGLLTEKDEVVGRQWAHEFFGEKE